MIAIHRSCLPSRWQRRCLSMASVRTRIFRCSSPIATSFPSQTACTHGWLVTAAANSSIMNQVQASVSRTVAGAPRQSPVRERARWKRNISENQLKLFTSLSQPNSCMCVHVGVCLFYLHPDCFSLRCCTRFFVQVSIAAAAVYVAFLSNRAIRRLWIEQQQQKQLCWIPVRSCRVATLCDDGCCKSGGRKVHYALSANRCKSMYVAFEEAERRKEVRHCEACCNLVEERKLSQFNAANSMAFKVAPG